MEKKKKQMIKSTVYKKTLQNFERSYINFLNDPILENYIEVKDCQKAFLECKNTCLSKKEKEVLDGMLKKHYSCYSFAEIEKFEEILKIREERDIETMKLINYVLRYEAEAHRLGKKTKANYSEILIDYLDKLDEIELNTKVGKRFPKESYEKLPTPSKLKLSDLLKLKDFNPDLNKEPEL